MQRWSASRNSRRGVFRTPARVYWAGRRDLPRPYTPPPLPFDVLNIGAADQNHFELQSARLGEAFTFTKTQAEIEAGYSEFPLFYTTPDGQWVRFLSQCGATPTSGASAPRTELRESNPDGSQIAFDARTGTHRLRSITRINHLPPVNPAAVVGQLHNGTTGDRISIRTQLVSGQIKLLTRINGTQALRHSESYVIGSEFEWMFEIISNQIFLYFGTPGAMALVYTSAADILADTGSASWYFKLGAYNQSTTDDPAEYTEVDHRPPASGAFVTHSIPVFADAPPVDITAQPVQPGLLQTKTAPPVDITTQPVAVTGQLLQINRPAPVDIQVQPTLTEASLTADITLDVPPVNITAQPVAIGQAKRANPTPVDVTTQPAAISAAQVVLAPPVDITMTAPPVTFTIGNTAQPQNVTVEVLPVQVVKSLAVPPVNIDAQAPAVVVARTRDIAPVDIPVSLAKVSAYTFRSTPVDTTVQLPAVKALHQANPAPRDVQVQATPVTAGRIYDIAPVNIVVQRPAPSTLQGDSAPVDITVQVLPVTVSFSADTSQGRRDLPIRVIEQPTRVLAQNILTGAWLHTDLPVSNLQITHTLSGPQNISGDFPTEIRDLTDAGLEPWGTWIHVEENDEITASGILQPASVDTGQKLSLEAIGVSAYPKGIPYMGDEYAGIQVDPAEMIRKIWAHLQSYPDAKLGVEVIGTTPVRIGEADSKQVDFTTTDGDNVSFETKGPYRLQWWQGTDCGSEIDDLAKETPVDYVERQFWNNPTTKDYVRHQIVLGYPRIGTRRTDLIFAQDENLKTAIGPEETPGMYASQVVLLGKGEGSSRIRGYAGQPLGTRIRRVSILDNKTVDTTVRANALSNVDLQRRQAILDISEITVKARHANARLGEYICGDDVPISAVVPWAGEIYQWERILSFTYSPDQETVRIELRRSESFQYGGTA